MLSLHDLYAVKELALLLLTETDYRNPGPSHTYLSLASVSGISGPVSTERQLSAEQISLHQNSDRQTDSKLVKAWGSFCKGPLKTQLLHH